MPSTLNQLSLEQWTDHTLVKELERRGYFVTQRRNVVSLEHEQMHDTYQLHAHPANLIQDIRRHAVDELSRRMVHDKLIIFEKEGDCGGIPVTIVRARLTIVKPLPRA